LKWQCVWFGVKGENLGKAGISVEIDNHLLFYTIPASAKFGGAAKLCKSIPNLWQNFADSVLS
jgi:hypothetical protein